MHIRSYSHFWTASVPYSQMNSSMIMKHHWHPSFTAWETIPKGVPTSHIFSQIKKHRQSIQIKKRTAVTHSWSRTLRQYLKKNPDITAIFAISDFMATGVAKAICDLGLKIGKDISVVGFDGMDISEFYNPGI